MDGFGAMDWDLSVERGPDWLFVKVKPVEETSSGRGALGTKDKSAAAGTREKMHAASSSTTRRGGDSPAESERSKADRLRAAILEAPSLADRIVETLERHLSSRVVLELDEIELLRSVLIGQLVLLYNRIHDRGGVLRISGLSQHNGEVLHACHLDDRLPPYCTRHDAVWSVPHFTDESTVVAGTSAADEKDDTVGGTATMEDDVKPATESGPRDADPYKVRPR